MGLRKLADRHLPQRGYVLDKAIGSSQLDAFLALLKPQSTGRTLIRIGATGDGGYLVPDDLDSIEACFSPGVAETADFESALADAYGIRSHLADYSVEGPPTDNPHFTFIKRFLGSVNSQRDIRLEDWVSDACPAGGDLLLQMDIEGAEFSVLCDTPQEVLRRFRIVVIEIHAPPVLYAVSASPLMFAAFEKIRKHFVVAHIHANNCTPAFRLHGVDLPPIYEVTFYRKDRCVEGGPPLQVPHKLDQKNVADRPDLTLPQAWRS